MGHVVEHGKITYRYGKGAGDPEWTTPANVWKRLRSFLGLANYYRRFVEGYSKKSGTHNKVVEEGCYMDVVRRSAKKLSEEGVHSCGRATPVDLRARSFQNCEGGTLLARKRALTAVIHCFTDVEALLVGVEVCGEDGQCGC
ncbi:uncharacterized protein LOC133030373 [Cannabis sativa]|uniref:uncharacterized protein LOC133030373 n=1 Tax=Cannabis sativa TaxID=3483 RepID=UPI0029CA0C1F|nr:uncharacterized protein LOC133030373 [Cannabis sativa]